MRFAIEDYGIWLAGVSGGVEGWKEGGARCTGCHGVERPFRGFFAFIQPGLVELEHLGHRVPQRSQPVCEVVDFPIGEPIAAEDLSRQHRELVHELV